MAAKSTESQATGFKKVWNKILGSNEKVECEFSISNLYRYIGLILGIFVGLMIYSWNQFYGTFTILFTIFYYGFYLKAANVFAFTNKRVLIHKGWLSTKVVSIDFKKITDVIVKEPLFTRLFYKAGHLVINTAGSSDSEVILKNVPAPYKLLKKLDELRKDA